MEINYSFYIFLISFKYGTLYLRQCIIDGDCGFKFDKKSAWIEYNYFRQYNPVRPVVAQRHEVWLQNQLVVGSIPTRVDEIFT